MCRARERDLQHAGPRRDRMICDAALVYASSFPSKLMNCVWKQREFSERQRESQRQRVSETERQRDKERDRDRERQRETERDLVRVGKHEVPGLLHTRVN